MSELTRRILFAVVAAPLVLLAVYLGDAALAALLGVAAAVAAWELYRMAAEGGVRPLGAIGIAYAALLPLLVHAHFLRVFTLALAAAATATLVVMAAAIWTRGVDGRPLAAVSITLFGVFYTGGMLSFAYGLRYHPYAVGHAAGAALLGLPVLCTWASDIGAYAVGRLAGRHKLIPAVSPGKTVEGALGGLAGTVLVAWIYVRYVLAPAGQLALTPQGIVLFGIVLSVAAQVGDLAESLFKREAGVKDSSRLLPGHGGVLDRLDSLFVALPVAYLLLDHLLIPAIR